MNLPWIVASAAFSQHLTGLGHPENPARYYAIAHALEKEGFLTKENTLSPRSATKEELLLCHSASYLALLEQEVSSLSKEGRSLKELSTGDVLICPQSFEVAKLAAGGACIAVDAVMQSSQSRAFALLRPPGHHASAERGMGFCLLNHVAIAARYAQKNYGVDRVAIIDWDVHHGNGTQEIFLNDPSIFYFSTHQAPLYPFTGKAQERGVGNLLNCPIAVGASSKIAVLEAFTEKLIPAMKDFQPQLVLISAGFDAHVNDPLGGMNLVEEDFALLTQIVKNIAFAYAEGRLVSLLEGGYHLPSLASSVVAHLKAL